MSAHQRFVFGVRLLLVAACLLVAGRVMWSRVDTRHTKKVTAPSVCVESPVNDSGPAIQSQLVPAGHSSAQIVFGTDADCQSVQVVDSSSWTTPNHVPGLALIVLGLAFGIFGAGLARSHPDEPDELASDTGL